LSVDVAVTATAFMDLTFVALEAFPVPGSERFAGNLLRSPGGGAINAIGAARLGLRTALASPLGEDLEAEFIREALAREGIELISAAGKRTPTTVVLPWDGERAMVTYDPGGGTVSAAHIAALAPRAAVVALDQLDLVPPGARAYATCGDDDARAFAGRPPDDLDGARALFLNRREALALTRAGTVEEAATQLASGVEIVVVTLGPDGAMAIVDGKLVTAPGFEMNPVDTTGAGDLLCAAFVWADLAGADAETALRWAVLYGALSVEVPTGAAGAVTRERLFEEASARGLPPLATGKETRR